IKGYADGTFKPDQYVTRAEFVTFVNGMLNRKVNAEGILSNAKQFKDLEKGMWYYEDIMEATNSHHYEMSTDQIEKWTDIYVPVDKK
ncbi:MAG: S-layer homology domain-containing protein, partial [Eubacteriales bacterium]|nr:S-layer homology domain-containing protein [Eubacteriales bacterium]